MAPSFVAVMFRFTGYRSEMGKLLNTKYEHNPFNRPHLLMARQHIKNHFLFHSRRGPKCVNQLKSQEWYLSPSKYFFIYRYTTYLRKKNKLVNYSILHTRLYDKYFRKWQVAHIQYKHCSLLPKKEGAVNTSVYQISAIQLFLRFMVLSLCMGVSYL
jgi:hypothetical protein